MLMGDELPAETPDHWMVYLAVDDADAAIDTVKRHGGSVFMGPLDIPVRTAGGLQRPPGRRLLGDRAALP
jgi:predicted enzyme related to lactoylglutathione lyase